LPRQTATHYLNGASTGSGQITASLADGGTDLKIGTRDDLFTQLKGDIAELLVFGHGLSVAERGQVLSYLGGKYGLRLVRIASVPPTVTITSPTNGATAVASSSISIQVSATDTNNPIAQVNFLANGNVVGSATMPPFSMPLLMVNKAGQPVLEFNGTNSQYLDVASAPSVVILGDISSFCAFNAADVATPHTLWSKTQNGAPFPWYFSVAAGGDMAAARGDTNGSNPVDSADPVQPGSQVVAGFTVSGSSGSHYLDGEPNGTGVFGYGTLDQGTTLRIGALDDLTNQYSGTLSEVLIYNEALSGSDLLEVNTYLAARAGIPVIQVPPPSLTLTRPNASSVELSWPTVFSGFVLESATNLAGAWTAVATNPPNNQFILGTTTNATRFFRLQSQ